MPDGAAFDAGSPALTLANASDLTGVTDYPALVEIFIRLELITGERANQLPGQAEAAPFKAGEALAEARILARVMRRIFTALAGGIAPTNDDINFFNGSLGNAMAHIALSPNLAPALSAGGSGFGWTWQEGGDAQPGSILWPLLRDAAELLTTRDPARIRLCQSANCERLFLDTSKAGRRRWCEMQTCGNRAKARRHARRHSQAG